MWLRLIGILTTYHVDTVVVEGKVYGDKFGALFSFQGEPRFPAT